MANASPLFVQEETTPYLDKDGLWKKVITDLFEPFMLFLAPDLYEDLDWSKTPDSLEQELRRAFPPLKEGINYTDKLMKVPLKNGKEQWILIHIEVQGYHDKRLSKRMFQYFYRIFDKYEQNIYAFALLADPVYSFKPTTYKYHFHGTKLTYSYNTYKLLDQDEEELLQSNNPFAYAIVAGIYMLKSHNDADKRYRFKRRLFELLLRDPEKNAREYIHSLLYFIDYLLQIPENMSKELQEEVEPMIEKEEILMDKTKHPDPPTLKPFIDKWREEGKKEIAEVMVGKNYSMEEIIEVTNLTEEELDEIKNKI